MFKDVCEINKTTECDDFIIEIYASLNFVNEKKIGIKSVIVFVEYGDLGNSDITYLLNGEKEKIKNLNLGLLKFRTSLTMAVNKYIGSGKVKANVYVGYNYTKDDFSKYLNMRDGKKIESEDAKSELDIIPQEPKFSFDKMVLNDIVKAELEKVTLLLKNKNKIYNDWGFSDIDSNPRCIINFYGPPGTGKTMAAHSLAKEIGKRILLLNYSDIESKYVGEAPKNLMKAFDIAKENDCVIFFDEADSFLGARIRNVQQSSDQAINSLRSQMLIQLESFNGIVIFATNLIENYDKAFESRILRNVKFELPDENLRIELIKKMIPKMAPVEKSVFDGEFLKKLSKVIDGFSPREIKNTLLETLISAVYEESDTVTKYMFEKSFERAAAIKNSIHSSGENPKKQVLTAESFGKKIQNGIESGDYVAYKASDLLEAK